jgi:hypothetical protein
MAGIIVLGLGILAAARPLAALGEMSGAILEGDFDAPFPEQANPLLMWAMRLVGASVIAVAWFA